MTPWTRRQAITTLGLAAGLPLLGACTEGTAPAAGSDGTAGSASAPPTASASPTAGTTPSPTPASMDPESVVETRTLRTHLGTIDIAVHPIVRAGDLCVLTLDLRDVRLPDGEDHLTLQRFQGDANLRVNTIYPEEWAGVRLVDPGGSLIRAAATGQERSVAGRTSWPYAGVGADGLRRQLVYAAPEEGVEYLGVLLPGWFLPQVPVIDGDVPEVTAADADEEPPGTEEMLAAVTDYPELVLEGYSRQLEGGLEVLESEEKIEIRLAGDVLFDSSSYELDARADAVLAAAAQSITDYAGGVVEIVGHTDDVGSEADNQVLSVNRAEAVAEDLSTRIDTSVYELRTAGRGESEPLVVNESDVNRQRNRRVTLTLTSAKSSGTTVSTAGEMPPFDPGNLDAGTEANGPEGFTRTLVEGSSYHISCPVVRRHEGLLEVTVLAERLEGGSYGSYGSAVSVNSAWQSYRGDDTGHSSEFAGFAPRLLVGATATYPLDYLIGTSSGGEEQEWRTASDSIAADDCLVGETVRFVALYRDMPGLDTIVVEQPTGVGSAPFRLTDIPIEG